MSTPVVEEAPTSASAPIAFDAVSARLSELGLNKDQIVLIKNLGAEGLEDLGNLTEADLIGLGIPVLKVRKLLQELVPSATTAPALTAASANMTSFGVAMLPQVPDDSSLLSKLGTFAGAKVDATDVIAATRVRLQAGLNLDGIEGRIAAEIESRALSMGEQVPPIWDELEVQRTRYAHADVLKALGKPGNLISAVRKKELTERIGNIFVCLEEYQNRLSAWQQQWMDRISNPGALMAGIAAMMGGGGMGNPATATLNEAPDPCPVLSATEGLIETFNKMFAGNGRAVARGMAADAIATRAILDRTDLPAALGATSREEMLRMLGIGVSSDVVRAERDVAQYIMGTMHLLEVDSQRLPGYIMALQQLGANVPWSILTGDRARDKGRDALPGMGDHKRF